MSERWAEQPANPRMRPFVASDFIGGIMACPHCGQLLKIENAEGPYVGHDPSENGRIDRFWILTLADGEKARMFEDRKGVLLDRVTS